MPYCREALAAFSLVYSVVYSTMPLSSQQLILAEICNKYWTCLLDASPGFAIYKGYKRKNNNQLDSYKLETFHNKKEFCEKLLAEAKDVDSTALSEEEQVSHQLLQYYLSTCIGGMAYEAYLMPYNYWEGVDAYFTRYIINRLSFNTLLDYENYLTLLERFPDQVQETILLLQEGIKKGIMPHKVSVLPSVPERLGEVVLSCPKDLPHYAPFTKIPSSFSPQDVVDLQQRGLEFVTHCMQKPLGSLKEFIDKEYSSQLRTSLSVDSIPGTPGRYQALIRFHCDTDMDPRDMHAIGLKEMSTLTRRSHEVMNNVVFQGTLSDFQQHLLSKEELLFKSSEEIIPYCRHVIDNIIRPKVSTMFHHVPDTALELLPEPSKEVPAKAVYNSPAHDGSKPAILWVWVQKPRRFLKSEVMVLMLHEAEPGHHLQACTVMDKKQLPSFRVIKDDRIFTDLPGRAPMNSAYTEGWGVYCEELGEEMGLYSDPYLEFSYLTYNLIRTARMVVDTGIHAMGWSREEAVNYMKENTPLSAEHIGLEINRYLTWCAQPCSYKFGHLKFKELRQKATDQLGPLFNIKDFHQACLDCGQVPLPILERVIDFYIQKTRSLASPSGC